MAAKTPTSVIEVQGIFKVFRFDNIDDGDNFVYPYNKPAFPMNRTASSNASIGALWVTDGYTFDTAADNLAVDLLVVL